MPSANGLGQLGRLTVNSAWETIFCPTARLLDSDGTSKDEPQARTTSHCFARGVKEKMTVSIEGGAPWRWRRIAFSIKDLQATIAALPTLSTAYDGTTGGIGHFRPNTDFFNTPTATNLHSIIFEGTQSLDWTSLFTATVDTSRVTLHYDKVSTYNNGNASGSVKQRNHWFPLNKNIVYTDDQAGNTMFTNGFSVTSREGMGDFYILDIIGRAFGNAVSGENLYIDQETTYFWHER